jgi:hypothetical protein
VTDRRELYRSPNGDVWFLARDSANGKAFVMHEPNQASGGQASRVEIGAFLRSDAEGPEHQALLRLIGSLVDMPPTPYPDRMHRENPRGH